MGLFNKSKNETISYTSEFARERVCRAKQLLLMAGSSGLICIAVFQEGRQAGYHVRCRGANAAPKFTRMSLKTSCTVPVNALEMRQPFLICRSNDV